MKKFHPDSVEELAPMKYKNSKNFLFSCTICKSNYNDKNNFLHHQRKHQASTSESPLPKTNTITKTRRTTTKCPMCSYSALRMQLHQHIEETHNIKINSIEKEFISQHEFKERKNNIELQTKSKFVIERRRNFKTKKVTMYRCHRSGNYVPEGKGLRRLKNKGSSKIGAYCPAVIKVTQMCDTEKVCIYFTETHVGHQQDIGYLTLTKEDREKITSQIALNIPLRDIIKGIRDSHSNEEINRIHLITWKDLYNIKQSIQIANSNVKDCNDAVSIDEWAFGKRTRTQSKFLLNLFHMTCPNKDNKCL